MKSKKRKSGQIVIEYVLLLAVSVTAASIITNLVVSRSSTSPGFVIKIWSGILQKIGADVSEE